MPHVPEVVSTSHDRHDSMLVAALAAGDLAGTERDQAIALTSSCADCASLHADLLAIAKATVSVPPPIAAPNRDFRLTAEQAADLRRTGWRRFLPAGSASRSLTRPLGVALATFGIVGLLIGSFPLGFGSGSSAGGPTSAAAPAGPTSAAAPAAPAGSDVQDLTSGNGATSSSGAAGAQAVGPIPAASAAAASLAPAAPAASNAITDGGAPAASAPAPDVQGEPFASQPPREVAIAGNASPSADGGTAKGGAAERAPEPAGESSSPSLLVVLSILAIVLGVVLLIVARRRENASA